MTRPQDASAAFVARLDPKVLERATICLSPLLEIVPVETDVTPDAYAGVVFTSAQAVRFVAQGSGRPAYCVGTRTAEVATARGWRVDRVAQDADALVSSLSGAPVEGPLLHLAGQHRRGEIAERLTSLGMQTDVAVVYDQVLRPLTAAAQQALAGPSRVIVPLFSPRTAAQFAAEAVSANHVTLIAISQAVADAAAGLAAEALHIAKAPTGEDMRRAVEKLLPEDSLG